jgi:hypothetical protein
MDKQSDADFDCFLRQFELSSILFSCNALHTPTNNVIIFGCSALFADGVAGCSGSSFVVDRLWQLLCAVLPARRRIIVSIPTLNQVSVVVHQGYFAYACPCKCLI